MIIDGNEIAREIYAQIRNEVSHLSHTPHMTVFTSAPNLATQKYLQIKQKKAKEVGIDTSIIELPETLQTQEVIQSVQRACMQTDAIVVQLPLPPHIDTSAVLAAIPSEYDVDGVHYDGSSDVCLPPVVAAIAHIAKRYHISFTDKKVVILGQGRLVGAPAKMWLSTQDTDLTVLHADSDDALTKKAIADADILILGTGVPHIIQPQMIKEGVVIFDAGTAEEGGELHGDAHPDCAQKALYFTPVPKGIGPITVAILLRNVLRIVMHHIT